VYWIFDSIDYIIQLKRFDNNGNKLTNFVDFPIDQLDLTKYVCPIKSDPNNYIYSLYAINYHAGNMQTGHYWSSVKNSDNNWYIFNDGNISRYNSNGDLKTQLVTSDAYILFYYRKFIKS
jgi:ubiquitin C-terminal hydrolase